MTTTTPTPGDVLARLVGSPVAPTPEETPAPQVSQALLTENENMRLAANELGAKPTYHRTVRTFQIKRSGHIETRVDYHVVVGVSHETGGDQSRVVARSRVVEEPGECLRVYEASRKLPGGVMLSPRQLLEIHTTAVQHLGLKAREK